MRRKPGRFSAASEVEAAVAAAAATTAAYSTACQPLAFEIHRLSWV